MPKSTIPRSRADLVEALDASYTRLCRTLDALDTRAATACVVDEWTAKDVLAVRLWWSEAVVKWVCAWRRGESPSTPAEGFGWKQTPALNQRTVDAARSTPLTEIRTRLDASYHAVLELVAELSDAELLTPCHFPAAGKYPIARWLSLNTARQYRTARTLIARSTR